MSTEIIQWMQLRKNITNAVCDISIQFDPLVDNFAFENVMGNIA